MITDFELGWLVGILEGEGYFGLDSKLLYPRVKVEMTDEDTLNKVAVLVQVITEKSHNLSYVDRKKANTQATFVLEVSGQAARKLMKFVVRHMSFRRRQRIWQTLNGHKPKKLKLDIQSLVASVTKEPV